ncbi:HAMP domain-containing sensor histidine kinase [Micromonospora sp. NPDC050200]|uniref:sensor histidine kinase n=1 Tax=Micromonospora sp. NPDC050200 TaxID=3155664 RepID=UPI0033CD4198
MRLTARARLTLLYTALVLAAGLTLTGLTYLLMGRNLGRRLVHVQVHTVDGTEPPPPLHDVVPDVADQVRTEALTELLTQAATALTVVTVFAAVAGWLVAGRVLRPIRVIAATAQRLSAEHLSERVPVTAAGDELAALAGTINGMLNRIQRGVAERDRVLDSQRMFTANAAHELRTPLTTMRTAIDVTLDGRPSRAELLAMAEDVRTAVDRSQRTLDGLLALAHSQASPGRRHPVDLAVVATAVLHAKAGEAAARGITVGIDLRPAPVTGDPTLLERLAGNLIDNAVRHNHPDGEVTVTTGTETGHAVLRVANTGPPIPADAVDQLSEPFVRGGVAGLGLGLSIVRAIVLAHSGELSLAGPDTGGLDVTVRLPPGDWA